MLFPEPVCLPAYFRRLFASVWLALLLPLSAHAQGLLSGSSPTVANRRWCAASCWPTRPTALRRAQKSGSVCRASRRARVAHLLEELRRLRPAHAPAVDAPRGRDRWRHRLAHAAQDPARHAGQLGYTGTVLLPVPLTIAPGFSGSHLDVKLHAAWLSCRKECIPEEGDFTFRIPVQGSTALNGMALMPPSPPPPKTSPPPTAA